MGVRIYPTNRFFMYLHPVFPFLKKAFFKLIIFNMSILKCVFLYSKSGKFCRF